jgi:acyl-coenzyme A thioesterase PaaI-like protein
MYLARFSLHEFGCVVHSIDWCGNAGQQFRRSIRTFADASFSPMSNAEQPAGRRAPTGKAATFDPAAAGWELYSDEGFIGLVGPFWTRWSDNAPLYAFMAEAKHHNRRGVVQGGMLMTFADRSMGMTCWHANEKQPQATVQLDVHFVDAVQIGEFVEAKCTVVRRTRSLVFMTADLVVGSRVVATANGVWKTLRKR